ncbi:AAA family ATPase [Lichenifustis flavocetrariae]|uniref:AAA family ATPase n=1 Tax=Lichenifustis flavocetrariae TaxID=2949735 RepID=A0AA42CKV7_9HYPH|nr:AAA family ATPase [Lichenifustis flavocetrariae]MCW6509691.1 AAA family ATPase [Lichenifustis flavocetrariae]
MDQYRPARLDDGPPELESDWRKNSREAPKQPPRKLPIVDAASFAGREVPERQWFVEGMMPAGTVTMLGGDGATGKSLLALQLSAATVLGMPWIGRDVRRGPVLFLTAEDDNEELHRRLNDILADIGMTFEDFRARGFSLCSLTKVDAVLGTSDAHTHVVKPTVWFELIQEHIRIAKPALVVLDPLSDLFAGDENQRTQARQFIGLLRRFTVEHGSTVLLLAHPSLSGLSSGSGTSGSTAWSNSVRSRLYFERVKRDGGAEDDPDARVLKVLKANYGAVGAEIKLRWREGVFILDGKAGSGFAAIAVQARADQIFMDLLGTYTAENRYVSPNRSSSYAPAVFAKDQRAGGMNKKSLEGALNRLLAARRIEITECGPASRKVQRLRRC